MMLIYEKIKNLKNFIIFIFILCFNTQVFASIFDYDIASYYGQKGNWLAAKDKLKNVFIDRSDDPNVLYDLAVASFNTGDFCQAAQYFKTAANSDLANVKLKEQANFNLGNTNVELKNLQDAIGNYEQVLKINPENLRARHNLEVVRKMLEKQKQQDEKDKKKENKEQDKNQQDKEKKEQASDNQKNNSQEKNKQDGKNRQDSKSPDKQKNEQQGEKNNSKNGPEDNRDKTSKQNQGKNNNGANNGENKQGPEGKPDKNDKLENTKGQACGEKSGEFNKEKSGEIKQLSAELVSQEGVKNLDKRTVKILGEIDKFDKKNSKEFMKTFVEKNMTGKYGQNLW